MTKQKDVMVNRQRVVAGLALALCGAATLPLIHAAAQTPSTDSRAFDWLDDEQSPRRRQPPAPQPEARPAEPEWRESAPPQTAEQPAPAQNQDAAGNRAETQPAPAQPETPADAGVAQSQPQPPAETPPPAQAEAPQPSGTPTQQAAEPSAPQPETPPAAAAPQPLPSQAETQPQPAQPETPPQPAQAETQPSPTQPESPPSDTAAQPVPAAPSQAAEDLPANPKEVKLRIATWAGAYGQSQQRSIIKPFSERYKYQLETITYDGDYGELEKQGGTPKWSVVDMNGDALARACDDQLLERLDPAFLGSGPGGAPVAEDFLPGAVQPCGIASLAWSAVIVYDKRLGSAPDSVADLFNLDKIPGKRLLPKQPRYSLELALLADGVAPGEVYATLRTPEGQDRAFRKLSSIKDDIVWWDNPAEVFERLANREAAMGIGFNGRAFMAIMADKHPLAMLWDGQVYAFDYWAIPKGAKFQQAAREFIRFATGPKPLAEQAAWIPYGPARRTSLALVGQHPELGLDMKPFLPTHDVNLTKAVAFDGTFWKDNETALTQRFADWVKGRQLPTQKSGTISQ
jgi:putative spermidine/putrescine transport system substrate-binding protein